MLKTNISTVFHEMLIFCCIWILSLHIVLIVLDCWQLIRLSNSFVFPDRESPTISILYDWSSGFQRSHDLLCSYLCGLCGLNRRNSLIIFPINSNFVNPISFMFFLICSGIFVDFVTISNCVPAASSTFLFLCIPRIPLYTLFQDLWFHRYDFISLSICSFLLPFVLNVIYSALLINKFYSFLNLCLALFLSFAFLSTKSSSVM